MTFWSICFPACCWSTNPLSFSTLLAHSSAFYLKPSPISAIIWSQNVTTCTFTKRSQMQKSHRHIDLWSCSWRMNNNSNNTERCNSRFLQSPHYAANCLQHVHSGHNHVKITCYKMNACHVQHVVCHIAWRWREGDNMWLSWTERDLVGHRLKEQPKTDQSGELLSMT